MTDVYNAFLSTADDDARWGIVQDFWAKLGGSSYGGYPDGDSTDADTRYRFSVHVQGTELDLTESAFLDVTMFLMKLAYDGFPNVDPAVKYLKSEARA